MEMEETDNYFDFTVLYDQRYASEAKSLVEYLESNNLKGYLHDRDSLVGQDKTTEIFQSIHNSRYTIALMTPGFLANDWERYKLEAAFISLTSRGGLRGQDGRSRLLPVAVGMTREEVEQERNLEYLCANEILVINIDDENYAMARNRLLRTIMRNSQARAPSTCDVPERCHTQEEHTTHSIAEQDAPSFRMTGKQAGHNSNISNATRTSGDGGSDSNSVAESVPCRDANEHVLGGFLLRKCEWQSLRKKAFNRSWEEVYTVLSKQGMSFFKDKEHSKQFPRKTSLRFRYQPVIILLNGAFAIAATNYRKRTNVFRLTLNNGTEYLFQNQNEEDMNSWIDNINLLSGDVVLTQDVETRCVSLPATLEERSRLTTMSTGSSKQNFFTFRQKSNHLE